MGDAALSAHRCGGELAGAIKLAGGGADRQRFAHRQSEHREPSMSADPSWGILLRLMESFGVGVLILIMFYRLTDKWASKFLEALVAQSTAMTTLAAKVSESGSEQRDVLLAMRVLATKQDETREWIKELGQRLSVGSAPR